MTDWGLPRARNRQELIAKDYEGLSKGDVNVLYFGWSGYNPIREDERFKAIYEKAKKLKS